MKKIISIIFLSLLTFRAEALSMEVMYKYCKPWQSKGFDTNKISKSTEGYCGYYFSGLIDAGHSYCVGAKYVYKNRPNDFNITVDAFIELNANSDVSLSSVVASFIKFAENNRNNWQIPAWTYKDAYLHKAFPCNYKN